MGGGVVVVGWGDEVWVGGGDRFSGEKWVVGRWAELTWVDSIGEGTIGLYC